jgi:hypothetical protein
VLVKTPMDGGTMGAARALAVSQAPTESTRPVEWERPIGRDVLC